jgi:hypothetical protein
VLTRNWNLIIPWLTTRRRSFPLRFSSHRHRILKLLRHITFCRGRLTASRSVGFLLRWLPHPPTSVPRRRLDLRRPEFCLHCWLAGSPTWGLPTGQRAKPPTFSWAPLPLLAATVPRRRLDYQLILLLVIHFWSLQGPLRWRGWSAALRISRGWRILLLTPRLAAAAVPGLRRSKRVVAMADVHTLHKVELLAARRNLESKGTSFTSFSDSHILSNLGRIGINLGTSDV